MLDGTARAEPVEVYPSVACLRTERNATQRTYPYSAGKRCQLGQPMELYRKRERLAPQIALLSQAGDNELLLKLGDGLMDQAAALG